MKKSNYIGLLALSLLFFSMTSCNEVTTNDKQNNKQLTEAENSVETYKALYVVNSIDDKRVKAALRNMNNVLGDPRLKDKLELQLIVFSDGVDIYKEGSPYYEDLKSLHEKGVTLSQCEKTLTQRNINKSELFPFVSYVPTGNGEIILRQYEGWAIVYP